MKDLEDLILEGESISPNPWDEAEDYVILRKRRDEILNRKRGLDEHVEKI